MTTLLLTTPGAGNLNVNALGLSNGSNINVETWGAGSGGAGRTAAGNDGAGGGGGAWAKSIYTITPSDMANGISYFIGIGSAGIASGNSVAGGNTNFSNNNINLINNTVNNGAIAGTPGTLPTNWSYFQGSTGLSTQIVGFGTADPQLHLPYIDIRIFGVTAATTSLDIVLQTGTPATSSIAYTETAYLAIVGGTTANVNSGVQIGFDEYTATPTYIKSDFGPLMFANLTSTLQRTQATFTVGATTKEIYSYVQITGFTTAKTVDITIRIAGFQLEQASTPTFYKSTPGYTRSGGGAATLGGNGGRGGNNTVSIGSVTNFHGGNGAAFNVNGSGGGGSAGKDGIGNDGTIAGVGGQGDLTIGGAGGAVSATSPGHDGTTNTEGGGGGGSLKTVASGTAGNGGFPGGGGGGAVVSGGQGGTGANGQIRITYTASAPTITPIFLDSIMFKELTSFKPIHNSREIQKRNLIKRRIKI